MDWAVETVTSVDKEELKLIRETLEAKLKAEAGQYGEAARILWELLITVRRQKNRRWECMTMLHMGKVYRALRWSIALSLFEEVLELSEELCFDHARMMALVELGEMRCQWGQFEESLELFDQAMTLLQDGDLSSERIILLNKVIAHEGLGHLDTCDALLQEVIAIDKSTGSPDLPEDLAHLKRITGVGASG